MADGSPVDQSEYMTTYSCVNAAGGDPIEGSGPGPVIVPVEPDDAWVCTFLNIAEDPSAISLSGSPGAQSAPVPLWLAGLILAAIAFLGISLNLVARGLLLRKK
jgi:hypothetical protein